jgi:hypothetical protein
MAIHVITTPDAAKSPTDDVVYRQKMARANQVDATEEFKTETVEVEYGDPKRDDKGRVVSQPMTKIVLRYAYDSPFVFAVIRENPDWVNKARDLWQAVASDAIEKLFAVRGLQTKMAPKPEDTNRYNLMAEANAPIEHSARYTALRQAVDSKRDQMQKGIDMIVAAGGNPYDMFPPELPGKYKPIEG